MRLTEMFLGFCRRIPGVRFFRPLRAVEPDVELVVSSVGVETQPTSEVLSGEDTRRKQANSKRRSRQTASNLDRVRRAWARAWKYKRHDVHLKQWPSVDVSLETNPSDEKSMALGNGWQKMLDDGLHHCFVIDLSASDRTGNDWREGTLLFSRVQTINFTAACRRGNLLTSKARWFVEHSGVLVVPGRKPEAIYHFDAITHDGWVLSQYGKPQKTEIYHIDDPVKREGMMPIIIASCLNLQRKTWWDLKFSKGDARFMMPIDRVSAREIIFNREKEGRKRRSAAFHWVKSHTRADGAFVPAHLRGSKTFLWEGWDVELVESEHDRRQLMVGEMPEFSIEKYLDEQIETGDPDPFSVVLQQEIDEYREDSGLIH